MQTFYLAFRLEEVSVRSIFVNRSLHLHSVLISSGVMALFIWWVNHFSMVPTTKFGSMLSLLVIIPIGAILYGIFLTLLGFPELKALVLKLGRR